MLNLKYFFRDFVEVDVSTFPGPRLSGPAAVMLVASPLAYLITFLAWFLRSEVKQLLFQAAYEGRRMILQRGRLSREIIWGTAAQHCFN